MTTSSTPNPAISASPQPARIGALLVNSNEYCDVEPLELSNGILIYDVESVV